MSTYASQQLTDSFAIGNVFFNPTAGSLNALPTPFEAKTIENISLDWKGKNVELRGQYLVPVDARMADVSLTGKFTIGTWNLQQLQQLLFGNATIADGGDRINADEAQTIPSVAGGSPAGYFVTVTNAAGFSEDLGVSYQANSGQFLKVASPTVAGEYSVSAGGVYSFAAADKGLGVYISYVDTGALTGASLTIPNNLQGQTPQFEMVALIPGTGSGFLGYRFYACRATSAKILTGKNNDFQKLEIDFSVYCPVNANVGELIQTVV
jgi:hypothetical protein